ncbi:hypothetical protein FA95DRAFT_1606587 [Auriscalpium vulgare]|uniref:Uncharacterized protein n=1 Tax=Auriscalpium vulgare TaxID=40419 RepID=A0ACB8RT23_9AGAM|nr:hypothetical protein FA95DRAFT_1606587 [Auriscalpium vulgare]
MAHLPLELVLLVMDEAFYLPSGLPDWNTLAACAAVCRAWLPFAQQLLFHHTRVGCKAYAVATHIQHILNRPALANYIRRLELSVSNRSFRLHSPKYHASETQFASLVANLPQLYELAVHFFTPSLDPRTVKQLSQGPSRLQALDMLESFIPSGVVYQLLQVWPSIRFLCIRTELLDPLDIPRPPFSLYELSSTQSRHLPSLQWFIPPEQAQTTSPLQILEIGAKFLEVENEEIILAHAPHLRSLSLVQKPDAGFLDRFSSLEELVVTRLPLSDATSYRWPQTLQHIALWTELEDYVRPLHPFVHAIASLLRLRRVTVHGLLNRHRDYASLVDTCQRKGVELVETLIMNESRRDLSKKGYLVPVDRFPRALDALNRRKMEIDVIQSLHKS